MYTIKKNAIVFHDAEKMFKLVDDVESYPEFLPWCGGAELITQNDAITEANITINYHGLRQSFTTKNKKFFPSKMIIELVDGPFRKLEGEWRFIEVSKGCCRIELDLNYEFKNIILEKLIAPAFNMIANTFIDSFVKRAEED